MTKQEQLISDFRAAQHYMTDIEDDKSKALAVASAIVSALDPEDPDNRSLDYYLAFALKDMLERAVNEIGIRRHLDAMALTLGLEDVR